jgi:hypothetical protein
MSLIHGSQGIIYFVHLFGGPKLVEAALLEDNDMLQAVTRINQKLHTLAPILNSPSVSDAVSIETEKPGQIATMVKRRDDTVYLFAVAMRPQAVVAKFRLNIGLAGRVSVIGENRSIDLSDTTFIDHFDPYAVHLYKFSIGR